MISKNWGLWDEITSITRHNPPLASPDGHGYFLSLFAYSSLFPWWCLVAVALLSSSFCVFLAYIKTHHTIKPSGINGNGEKDTNYPSQPDGRYASLWARNSPPHSSYVLESTALWWAAAWALGSLSWSSPWMAVSLGCLCTALVCGAVTYFHLSVYKKNSAAVVGNSIGRIPGAINKSSDIISAIALLMFSGIMVLPLGLTFFSFVNPQVVFCVWLLLALFIHSWTGMSHSGALGFARTLSRRRGVSSMRPIAHLCPIAHTVSTWRMPFIRACPQAARPSSFFLLYASRGHLHRREQRRSSW